jgi:hypothetical protein
VLNSLRLSMEAVSFSNLRGIPSSIYPTSRAMIAMIIQNFARGIKLQTHTAQKICIQVKLPHRLRKHGAFISLVILSTKQS